MVLPFGSAPPEIPEKGHETSAPANPKILKTIIATSIISYFLFIIVKLVIESGVFAFR